MIPGSNMDRFQPPRPGEEEQETADEREERLADKADHDRDCEVLMSEMLCRTQS